MSLYRNLGPISFNSETQLTEIFETEKYWLIQLKLNKSQQIKTTQKPLINKDGQNPMKLLQIQAEKLNNRLNSKLLYVYNESGKTPSLLLKKENATKWSFQNNKNIQVLCLTCRTLLKTFQQVNTLLSFRSKIEKQLFFISNITHEIFYLNIPQFHLDISKEKEQIQTTKAIILFLEQNFCFKSNISNKLLIKKLKKCQKIVEIKQQLDYFENVYEIGRKKIQQLSAENENKDQSFHRQNSLIKNHRKYRKRSQGIFQQREEAKHQIISKLCSEHRYSSMKKQISLTNEKRISQSAHNQKQQSISFFSNRNTNSKAFHSSYSDLKQNFKGTVRSKGLFSTSRSNHKSYKLSLNNYKKESSKKSPNPNKFNYKNSLQKQKQETRKKQEQVQKQRLNQQKEVGVMKQQLNNHLKEWKQKRLRSNNAWLNQQKNKRQSKESLKQIRRKNKGDTIHYGDMENQQGPTNFFQQFSQKKIKNKTVQSTKMISIENQMRHSQLESELKKLPANPDEQETMRNNIEKENIKKIVTKKQSISKKQPIMMTQKEVLKPKQKDIQKQKTKRKCTSPSEVLEQSVIKNLKQKLEKINYVGQCVTNMPKYLANIKSGQKFFWQLPAFLIYKQFYSRRLEIEENLRSECRCLNLEKGQILNMMKQLEEQNKETKQSLIKLLKTGLKKLKKYQLDSQILNSAKYVMNLQFPFNYKRNHEMISDFIGDVEQMRAQKPELLSVQIQIIDAYFILKSLNFDIERRRKINVEDFNSQDTHDYFSQRFNQICDIINEGA